MLDKIKHIAKHSFVYSISNVALKASGIILLPIYTKYFTLEEYGRLGLLLITIIIFSQSLVLGQGLSIIRFNNINEYRNKRDSIFFTITVLILIVIAFFILIAEKYLINIAALFGNPNDFINYLEICIYIIAVITLNNLFLSKLRADDRSVMYTISGIAKLLVMMVLTVYFVVYTKTGIKGVLYGQLAGEISNTLIILPSMIKQMSFKFEFKILKESIRFGLPLIFSAVAINLLNGSDRFLIKFLANDSVLGLYELGYKVAGVINMFIIMPFGLTLMPLAYKMYRKENDKKYYAKIKSFVAFILIWMGMALSLYSKEMVMLFALNSSYYPAFEVVPVIVLAYIFYGISMISSLGMYLTGNNQFVGYITIFCAALNIGLNFWLIPEYGMMGAALNTVVSFAFLDILTNIASNRYYKIPYEHFKLFKLVLLGTIVFTISYWINDYNLITRVLVKFILFLIFPFLLIPLKYFEKKELLAIIGGIKKWGNPLRWKKNIQQELPIENLIEKKKYDNWFK